MNSHQFIFFFLLGINVALQAGNVITYHKDVVDVPCEHDADCQNKVINNFTLCHKQQCMCYDERGQESLCRIHTLSASNVIGGDCPCPIKDSICDQSRGICICSPNTTESSDKRRCIPKIVTLGETCEDNAQCLSFEENSECDLDDKICVCQANFTQVEDTCRSDTGIGGRCRVDAECLGRAKNSVCLDHKCICAQGFIARRNQTECLAVTEYGQPCSESGQCQQSLGFGGVCNSGLCVCNAAHQNISLGHRIICEKRIDVGDTCKEHGQCYHSHPLQQTMECIGGHCQCIEGFSEENRQCVENAVNCMKIASPILLLICMIVHKILN